MDDDLQALEEELRGLRPLAPACGLVERIATDLRSEPAPEATGMREVATTGRNNDIAWTPWLALPIAAAIAFAWVLPHRDTANLTPTKTTAQTAIAVPAFKPVAAQNVLVSSRDEGYVTLADGTTARRVRQSYVDTITWKNPRTNASLTWSVPREEVRITPVSYE